MTYISNNQILRDKISKFYLHECTALELAEEYFANKIYSAAATYYCIHINDLRNTTLNDHEKSYCFIQAAKCYWNQQLDRNYSNWQKDIIINLCKESIIIDNRIDAHLLLANIHELDDHQKNAYFEYKYVVTHIDQLKDINVNAQVIENCIYKFFEYAEYYFIVVPDVTINKIIKNITSATNINIEIIKGIIDRIYMHKSSIDERQKNIMNGII